VPSRPGTGCTAAGNPPPGDAPAARPLLYDPGEATAICYDPASGDTHLIAAGAAVLLQQLAGNPADVPVRDERALLDRAADVINARGGEADREQLGQLLLELRQLGLVPDAG
jgi:PqqD family protein of HPr-rel-A system